MGRQLFIHRLLHLQQERAIAPILALAVMTLPGLGFADKLTHLDGTVVEGTIKSETSDFIEMTTRHGDFRFDKSDLAKIERTSQKAAATPVPVPAVDNTKYIPAGPIDPFKPPQVPPLVRMIPAAAGASTTATTTAAPHVVAQPGAPTPPPQATSTPTAAP